MLDQSETSDMLKIKILNCSKRDMLRDLQRAPEFDQSALFKKVYEEEFGVFGGAPFGALLGDYEFNKVRKTSSCSKKISNVARRRTALPDGGVARVVQHGELHQPRCAARHRQDFRTTEYASGNRSASRRIRYVRFACLTS